MQPNKSPYVARRQKHGIYDVLALEGPLIRQLANRDDDVCVQRATEMFGDGWRTCQSEKAIKGHFDKLRTRVKTKIERLGVTINMQNLITLVYAAALCPERPIIKFLIDHFKKQDDKLKEFNAAASMAARKVAVTSLAQVESRTFFMYGWQFGRSLGRE